MPGILPMKIIKIGTTGTQSRIAQACDRCRSKKIRCDGVRPCCSQCANVGFECKTSDKLSRRAFPRGYTESLEERVRHLEQEVRELKDILDEKDEKIDMLSRIHSQSSQPLHSPFRRRISNTPEESSGENKAASTPGDEVFQVQQSPSLVGEDGSDSYFSGTSSSRTLVEAFKHRIVESGRSNVDIDTNLLLTSGARSAPDVPATPPIAPTACKAPGLVGLDKLVNIFWQQWSPLFPVLHQPSFLEIYTKYTKDQPLHDRAEIAQLNLVFGIACLSNGTRSSPDLASFESQWKPALDAILVSKENSMAVLQCLILAQLYCIQKGDLAVLTTYKGLSTTLSAHLGLHQSQERFGLDTAASETRKRVFWTLYTIDCFTAVMLGLPKHLKDDDIQCECPTDANDDLTTGQGFMSPRPNGATNMSSALALFRAARILSKVLTEVFPATSTYNLSLKRLGELSDELDAWRTSLAPYHRLEFTQGKPSTRPVHDRSPILAFTYHYIRALLQRPVLCASLGPKESPYLIGMASSCKHMIQILQLLDERALAFTFCLNRDEALVAIGFGLLFQCLGLDRNSRILKDNAKMLSDLQLMLKKSSAPCTTEFARVVNLLVPAQPEKNKSSMHGRHHSDGAAMSSSQPISRGKQFKNLASSATNMFKLKPEASEENRRATVHGISLHPHSPQTQSVPSLQPQSLVTDFSRSEPARSPVNYFNSPATSTTSSLRQNGPSAQLKARSTAPRRLTSLDYLSFDRQPQSPQPLTQQPQSAPIKTEPGFGPDWGKIWQTMAAADMSAYEGVYDAPQMPNNNPLFNAPPSLDMLNTNINSDNTWLSTLDDASFDPGFWALSGTESIPSVGGGHAGSVLSFTTDEAGSSGEDLFTDWTSASSGSNKGGAYNGKGTSMIASGGAVKPFWDEADLASSSEHGWATGVTR